ncbi:response regulator transcription factor [Dermacoccaceae bacterium W4C1]
MSLAAESAPPVALAPAADEASRPQATIRILMSHPCRLTGEVLAQSLVASGGVAGMKLVASNDELAEIAEAWKPHVVVMAGVSGPAQIELARALAESRGCGVVVVATEPSRASVDATLGRCNVSLLSHHSPLTHLVHAVRGAAVGCPTIDSSFSGDPGTSGCTLTDREREVLLLTTEGLPLKEIATRLYLTPGTVRNISSAAIRKLSARNRYDAARAAHAKGWL